MTPTQLQSFYFKRCWTPLSIAFDWRMAGGRLVADLTEQQRLAERWPEHAAKAFARVITTAFNLAKEAHRAVTAEDLRHACNAIASARQHTSSKTFTQRELNQFDRLCAILRDPWDMNAMLAWEKPEEDDRDRFVKFLKTTAWESALVAIARNKYPGRAWTQLTIAELSNCYREVVDRPSYQRPRRPAPAATGNTPF